ncbi:hypothetical protein [Sphingomonas arenae]|uniref:hypothetical protein n=1 Tax=Sphingomonas arenae TaxID=2812555 RepID=UPI00196898AE|nr:hypothetical protein [Sphingomonas arenae]
MAFLRALARHGVARQAAFEAGIDFTTAYARRKRDADFSAAWREAAAEGETARSKEEESRSQGLLDDITNRGSREEQLRTLSGEGPQLVKAAHGRWSARREAAFLAELAASANVRSAAAAAGISTAAIYQRRLKQPGFAQASDGAIQVGRARLEALLLEAAERQFDPAVADLAGELPPVSTAEAIRLLSLTRPRADPGAKAAPPAAPAWPKVDDDVIIARLEKGLKRYAPPPGEQGKIHELVVVTEEEPERLSAATVGLCCPHCDGIVQVRYDESSDAWNWPR